MSEQSAHTSPTRQQLQPAATDAVRAYAAKTREAHLARLAADRPAVA
ncbi:hypothetical protein [Streptomyces erythrochromogenes]